MDLSPNMYNYDYDGNMYFIILFQGVYYLTNKRTPAVPNPTMNWC